MMRLTAIIRCKPDAVDAVLAALKAVGDYARTHEPDTVAYAVTRSADDPTVLVTHERFRTAAAMQAHNEGEGSKAFFAAAEGLLEDVAVHTGEEEFVL